MAATQPDGTGIEATRRAFPGQVVLVFQGGGALGAYQGGVYQALHEADIQPRWVIGTSIGAINGAIIAGNAFEQRLERMREFWARVEHRGFWSGSTSAGLGHLPDNLLTLTTGIPGFFLPNAAAAFGLQMPVGADRASFYSTAALRATLTDLVDFGRLASVRPRFTVGAVNVRTGQMRYFDSRDAPILLDHVLASGALPPAFPAIRIDGDPYWDGGVYSNTPIEAVFDDHPRRNSVIFAVQMWHAAGPEPDSIWQVLSRQKDIQYASRADSHLARQGQMHHLRHVVRELIELLPAGERDTRKVRELSEHGCGTTMHIVRLNAPRLPGEDHTRDIDFTRAGIEARWQAGYADTVAMLERRPWDVPVDPHIGVAVHDTDGQELQITAS
jgi:NTE family protein